eukprot:GHVN01105436.1.p1 GENE.GHVN01105436.1~~GHVN01105436.1.p1  ORF type:complete len:349 (-),score=51.82 GHVN01105436.1:171-1184(-)
MAQMGEAGESGGSVSVYCANESMDGSNGKQEVVFSNCDAEVLIIPQEGELICKTELGSMTIAPLEIAVIPRALKFQINLPNLGERCRGYVCENYGHQFTLPELGPIGASSGLANPRHFLTPEASYEDREEEVELITKFQGNLWTGQVKQPPFDVVAWYGSHVPYKYDLTLFNTINSVSFDHPDPSIYTVLTSQTDTLGKANIDFVVFPTRWAPMENTFRPPYFHRNVMSEFMGSLKGEYDSKKGGGFRPGGCSLHNMFGPHGPDAAAYEDACARDTSKPEKIKNTMSFMLESSLVWNTTRWASASQFKQSDYGRCWEGLKKQFDPNKKALQTPPLCD